ncbi:MAG TPA: fatty acid cis/trans isomerase [Polyangiales bacterium]|nr:fatty acid cis/trans isomerase [Polyangiales bacterium]
MSLVVACSSSEELAPVVMPLPTSSPEQQVLEWQAAKGTFDRRCVVCHGCYDAPCQLKLSSWDGIARGATDAKVYDTTRLREAKPTRLNIDESTVEGWRARGFFPILPENEQLDPARSLITRMLELKRENPLPLDSRPLSKSFELGLDREESCPVAGKFDEYRRDHPTWGMPYALPGLADADHQALTGWVAAGTPHQPLAALAPEVEQSVARWEAFFNAPGLKEQVVSRYIYEHLFLGSLYFEGLDEQTFFRLVRSHTPSGMPIVEIPTRRPYEDPGQPTFFYRLQRRDDTRLYKTQIPYPLSDARMARYRELFFDPPYEVTKVPGYRREVASNPFEAFAELPVGSRYRFMLDDAQFIMAGFIKGPVCRGQVALNVIEDRFWILFLEPDSPLIAQEAQLLAQSQEDLSLPAEMGSNNLLVTWRQYAKKEERFLQRKSDYLNAIYSTGAMTQQQIWDGDARNDNAALTVTRHFDSATVVKGLIGGDPKTAWVLDYSLFERIHYLLVAGYDVFGNIGHQLQSRMYMDFLRMEGEFNFLTFLPSERRKPLMESWYRDTDDEVKDHVYGKFAFYDQQTGLTFQTATPEHELFEMFRQWVAPVLERKHELGEDALAPLSMLRGKQASLLAEISFVEVRKAGGDAYFTLLRDSAHTNVAHLFEEEERRVVAEDQLTVLRGFVGAYPNTLYSVAEADVPAFVAAVTALDSDLAYTALRDRFGVRRTDPRFWDLSDRMHAAFPRLEPLESGLFDYNRLAAE